jgi:DNA-binding transcriptional LysR family regulator
MQPFNINLFKIKVLAEVCKTNSYRITAKNLYITPSSVSKIIKGLEKDWNIQLVESKGNSIKVKETAEQLAGFAAKLLLASEDFNAQLLVLTGKSSSAILKIGSGGSHTKIIMNRVLQSFLQYLPDLQYEVTTNNSEEILRAVENGELDCGIVSGLVPEHVNKELIYQDSLSLYAYHQHPLIHESLSLRDVEYPICLREKGSSTRFYVEQFLAEQGIQLQNSRQTGKNDELTDHFCKTQGAMQFLSDFYYQNSHWKTEYLKINCNDLVVSIPVYFIIKKNFPFAKLKKYVRSVKFQDDTLAS